MTMANQYDKPCNQGVLDRYQRYKADKPILYLAYQKGYRADQPRTLFTICRKEGYSMEQLLKPSQQTEKEAEKRCVLDARYLEYEGAAWLRRVRPGSVRVRRGSDQGAAWLR
jgi:hypothetical protein